MGTLYLPGDHADVNYNFHQITTTTIKVDRLANAEDNNDLHTNKDEETRKLLKSLPTTTGWRTKHLYLYQGFWCQADQIQAIHTAQSHYKALDSDVMVATVPKSGTTWLKALVYAIVHRDKYSPSLDNLHHPLLGNNSHDLVPFLEYKVYLGCSCQGGRVPDLSLKLGSPRLVASHVPYGSLPESIKTSRCKIVYICRNPLDTFVSIWHFMKRIRPKSMGKFTMEEAFNMYCKGEVGFGPYWDHMLGYWNQSRTSPHKVMFIKYEDLKKDHNRNFTQLKRLAQFLGYGFTAEEERRGLVDQVAKLCSFDNLKGLEVNKRGKSILEFDNKGLFRKGEVGDWANHLSVEMVRKLNMVMDDKLAGSGLEFDV